MTSLAQQLKRLAVPQTKALLGDDTKKASFLYEPKKAASIDRETFFCIGINGLEELSAIDDEFEEFESSLFSESSITFERSIESKEVNEQLDNHIESFLLRISPFLQLSSAHKALEWLVQRYRIHQNNVDSLVQCFLPYHETELFPRMLQLIDLLAHRNQKWAWLLPLQKNGVHLTRQTLVSQCRTNPAFLAIITDLVPAFVKAFDPESKNRADRLRVVMNFYALTLIAILDSGPVTERILSAILPVLCRGLKSDLLDYKAASYGIVCKVLQKSTLKTSLLETLMNAVCKNLTSDLAREGVCVLLLMFQTQDIDRFTKKSFKYLSQLTSLPSHLASLSVTFQASCLVSAVLQRLIPAALKQTALDVSSSNSSSICNSEDESHSRGQSLMVVYDIITQVSMDPATARQAIRLLLENFVQYCGSDAIDQEEVVTLVKRVVRIFETRYPDSLDAAVDNVMSSAESEKDKQAIKHFLNLSVSSIQHRLAPDSHATLALCLHHRHSTVRLNAITYLMDNLSSIDDKDSVKETMLARLYDENSAVVRVVLKDPQKLRSVFENEQELTSALLGKLKIVDSKTSRVELVCQILKVLELTHGQMPHSLETMAVSYLLLITPRSSAVQLVIDLLSSQLVMSSSLLLPLAKAWLPEVKKLASDTGEITTCDLSLVNKALIDNLALVLSTLDSPAVIDKLLSDIEVVSHIRQKCLAYLLCEVNLTLTLSHKTEEHRMTSRLLVQFTQMFRRFLTEKTLFSLQPPEPGTNDSNSVEVLTQLCKSRSLPASWWINLLRQWIASLVIPEHLKVIEFWHSVQSDTETELWLQAVVTAADILAQIDSHGKITAVAKTLRSDLEKVFDSSQLYLRYLCLLLSEDYCKCLGETHASCSHILQLMQTYILAMNKDEIIAVGKSSAPVVPCLLALCTSDTASVRRLVLQIFSAISEKCPSSALYKPVMDLMIHYQQEIISDSSYLATALTALLTKGSKQKGKKIEALFALLKVVASSSTPPFIAADMLQALSGIDTMDTLVPLLPLMAHLLEQESLNSSQLKIMQSLLVRFTPCVAAELTCDGVALPLLTRAIKGEAKLDKVLLVQEMAITQIDKNFFAALPNLESQRSIAGSLLDVLQTTTDTSIATLIRKIFKHVSLPAELLSEELGPILRSSATSVREIKRQHRLESERGSAFDSPVWLRATVLLEILQTKKKIPDGCKLVPVCFQILTKVLEVENSGEAEYLKQLILGVIHNLCHKQSSDADQLEGKHLNLEAIVQCIRTSHNPHTHQQALLVLSVAAQIAPEQLLHSMMSVFIFMGASILRQDDSYSFQVITRILETVFPALVMACDEDKVHSVVDMVTMVLRVFVDAYPHIPEHRKLMVFATLLRVVGVENYMWRLLLVFIEGVAVRSKSAVQNVSVNEPNVQHEGKSRAIEQVHMDFIITLVLEFSPLNCLHMACKALEYLAELPDGTGDVRLDKHQQHRSAVEATKEECEIFSLVYHNNKQLHRFRHATVLTLCHLLSNRNFIAAISDKLNEETMEAFGKLLETLLAYICRISQAVDHYATSPQAEYWRGLLNKCSNLLDSLVSLLPQEQFLKVVYGLFDSSVITVQRKAMELLASRLKQFRDSGVQLQVYQTSVLLKMIPKLLKSVQKLRVPSSETAEDTTNNGKMALYTLMLLSRVLGIQHHVIFMQVLKQVCEVLAEENVNSEVIATALMCGAEIISCMRAHAIVHLPQIIPALLQQLQATVVLENDILFSCVTSLHKIIDTLPHFLTPYLQEILIQVCYLHTFLSGLPPSEQREQVLRSLKHTSKSIATLPPRVFLPTVAACYTSLLDSGRQDSVISLLNALGQHVSNLSREDLNSSHHQLLTFFLTALDFRITQRKEVSIEVIDRIEGAVIETIITMVLKMAEGTFRPMLLKIFEWTTSDGANRDRLVTFYRLADCLAGKLRGIFLLFAAHIIKHAAQLLDLLNTSKREEPYLKKDKKGHKSSQLLNSLLSCLQKVCLYDSQNFMNKDRCNMLLQPLLDQIENFVGGEDLYKQRVMNFLVPAIADFAAATKKMDLAQTLNYQLMLKSKHSKKEIRLATLQALKEMHKKLGDDYLNLLPETVNFLFELMEDDCEEVENLTQEVIAEMEKTLGEPLQNYFS